MGIRFNCKGKITIGAHSGWYMLIESTEENPGYLIIIANDLDFASTSEGFDQWARIT